MQKNKCLQDALRELVSIVEIHADATGNNFAWAELVEARAALAEQEVDMEHKHTPGPWSAEPPNPEPEYGEHEKNYWSIRAPGPNGCISHEVARLSGWNIDRDEYTARLIAASPLMFDALETIAAGNTDPDQTVEIAQAALAKATAAPEKQDKPMRWPADFPGKHDKQERLKK